ncbi:hypothetical protein ACOI93_08115 [Corynebacterium striatum]|uniref:hypothetical protein n=1 Tax=Corynebacterium striatum TaxID=43770 RepID=UPI003B58B95B|nr:hypothetical protein [Corynebacterium striatum]HCD1824857.1 hypothetical protein [Corynebacterium striatum]HCD2181541.1 hypothetical protein [Corynebacterium striatum]HCD2850924.1 hypothetical protein [Corynebacterium striatum]HCD3731563.1 hypothetical protein [Corynebacterium striatum]
MKMIKKGDRLDLSGVFVDEGIWLERTDDKDVGEYQYSIPLSFSDDPASIAGAVDVSSSGEILGVELVMIQQTIANRQPEKGK